MEVYFLKNRNAFTMIELIFVIVIIGILAAVAMPKLAANRDNAEANILIFNASQILKESISYYTANGRISYIAAKTPEITYIPLYLNNTCRTLATMTRRAFVGSTLHLCTDGGNPVMQISTSNDGRTITLTQDVSSTPIYSILSSSKVFQNLTNGTVGKTYLADGS